VTAAATETTTPLADVKAACATARVNHAAAVASGSTWRIMQTSEALQTAEAELARQEADEREARLVPLRAAWEQLEREDLRDAERLEAALQDVVAPILRTMMTRFEERQRVAMSLQLIPVARHMEALGPASRERWAG